MAAPARVVYCLRQGDRALVLSQRLSLWLTRAHALEEEMALGNLGLDLLGQSRILYGRAGELEGLGRDEDDFAYGRSPEEFLSPLLLEQPDHDFAWVVVRQLFHDAWAMPFWSALRSSRDETLAALAGKAVRETAYHWRHARSWVVRLGDGTEESHLRTQAAVDGLWPFVSELFESDEIEQELVAEGVAVDPLSLLDEWRERVDAALNEGGLRRPSVLDDTPTGGRSGRHGSDFFALLDTLQSVAKEHPGARW